MPAIIQLLLLLTLLTDSEPKPSVPLKQSSLLILAVLWGVGAIGCLWSGVVPVITAARLLDQGNHEFNVGHRISSAEKYFSQAADADQLASGPHDQLAGIAFQQWQRATGDNKELFEKAIREKQESLARNPLAAKEFLTLSEWWMQRFQRTMELDFAKEAAAAAATGVLLYPNFSQMQAQLAQTMSASGGASAAHQAATRALELDDLNIARGHVDKVLPEPIRKKLEEMTEVATPPSP